MSASIKTGKKEQYYKNNELSFLLTSCALIFMAHQAQHKVQSYVSFFTRGCTCLLTYMLIGFSCMQSNRELVEKVVYLARSNSQISCPISQKPLSVVNVFSCKHQVFCCFQQPVMRMTYKFCLSVQKSACMPNTCTRPVL